LVTRLFGSSIQDKDRQDYLGLIEVPDSYCEVLFETKKVLQQMPNFTHTSTSPSKEITIC
ncbi:hypothetical protein Celaphus_00010102, partial [Cervus elaphus hippelaphus]